jgi:biopolymer transport protein ExbB
MIELMHMGGPLMWLILLLSLALLTLFLQRVFHLHRAHIRSGDFLKGIFNNLQRGNVVEAVSICEETPGPVAQIVRAAILEHKQGPDRVQRVMEEVGLTEITRLEKHLTLILTMAQALPMVGLLGTVLGLMQILMTLQQKAPLVQAGDLGAGMWQALLTTAAGLAAAIPGYAGYNFLVTRIEAIVVDMERVFAEVTVFLSQLNKTRGG